MKINKIVCLLAGSLLLAGCNNKNPESEIKKDPSRITTYSANGEISFLDEYIYDESGNLIQLSESNYFEGEVEKSRTIFHYASDLLISEEVDYYDNETEKWDETNYFSSYSYAPNGNMIERSIYNKVDDYFINKFKFIYHYDENNNVISEEYLALDDESGHFVSRVYEEYTYNDTNKLIKESMYSDWDGDSTLELTGYETYTYNDNGLLTRDNEYDENDKLEGYTAYTYEADKTIKTFTLVDDETEELRTQNVTFYDADNRIEKEEYSLYDKETSKFVLDNYTIYEY